MDSGYPDTRCKHNLGRLSVRAAKQSYARTDIQVHIDILLTADLARLVIDTDIGVAF